MTRRKVLLALGTALGLTGSAPAQYAIRGGPLPPQRGPSLYLGAYAPNFYPGPLPTAYVAPAGAPGAGLGFVTNYGGASPVYGGGYVTMPQPTYVSPPVYYPQGYAYLPQVPVTTTPSVAVSPPIATGSPGTGALMSPSEPAPAKLPAPSTGVAYFTVAVPADAKLWVNEVETKQVGDKRRFHTPTNLEADRTYEYTFRAQWLENGQTVTRDRVVRFKAKDDLAVDFIQTPGR